MKLILASSSASRNMLLSRFQLPFEVHAPNIDESAQPNEQTEKLVARLSREKAELVATHYPDACIIGGDQLICVGDTVLGKPLTLECAKKQLKLCSGKTVTALGGLAVKTPSTIFETIVPTYVTFKRLNDALIDHYLTLDNVLPCAGSIQAEAAGPLLFDAVESDDPTALIGLPLIALSRILLELGFFPNNQST